MSLLRRLLRLPEKNAALIEVSARARRLADENVKLLSTLKAAQQALDGKIPYGSGLYLQIKFTIERVESRLWAEGKQ